MAVPMPGKKANTDFNASSVEFSIVCLARYSTKTWVNCFAPSFKAILIKSSNRTMLPHAVDNSKIALTNEFLSKTSFFRAE